MVDQDREKRDYDILLKIILIGDSGTGKSSLMMRLVKNEFDHNRVSTIGIDFLPKTITIDSRIIKALFWDTCGQERYRTMTANYFLGAHGGFLVYDITERSSFENLAIWLKEIKDHANHNVVIMLIGNKCDREDRRQVSTEEALEFAQSCGLAFMETSAKDATGVNEAFLRVVTEMYDKRAVLLPAVAANVPAGQPLGRNNQQQHRESSWSC